MPSDSDWSLISDVFDAVADLPASEQRAALDRLCADADNPSALRAEVEALLAADAQATSTHAAFRLTDAASAAALVEDGPVAGERVGPWRVLRPIGRGGMGRVDLVERVEGGYQQQAALKRLSLVAPGRVRRFLRERQILARLEHPGIARLLDGGVADDGAPYLVMEYVEGVPITTYARTHDLSLRDRLSLFAQVCDAVAYAHRHLVVHRDLKPSNVLVGEGKAPTDPTGSAPTAPPSAQVSLLDFGIARLLDDDPDEPLTAEGPGAPLTPGYAAPEQVAGEAVTTATDVYALGVLLYELLTGRRPHPSDTRQAWTEAVLNRTPLPPSQTAPGGRSGVQRRLRGDLDAITLTALRREPEARYASAHDLAADVRRYLAGEAVEARAPSAWYRARRFVGRHRTATIAAGLVLLSVLGGAGATLWQAQEARTQATRSEATADFLAGLFDGADPTSGAGNEVSALDLLDRGARRLDAGLASEPDARADLYLVIGTAYLGLGQPDSAVAFARRALTVRAPDGAAPDASGAVAAQILLGRALFPLDPTASDAALADAIDAARSHRDPVALLDALDARGTLAGGQVLSPEETVAVLEEAVAQARRVEGDGSPRVGRLLATLAMKASSARQHGRVEGLLRDALDRLPVAAAPYDRSVALLDLAKMLNATGQPDSARVRADEALAIRQRLLGPDDVRTAEALGTRASLASGDARDSERDARAALRIVERAGDGATAIDVLDALGTALTRQERYDDAVEVYRRRVALAAEVYGTEGTRYPASAGTLARSLHAAGRYDEAIQAWDRALELSIPAYGAESAVVAGLYQSAAATAEVAGQPSAAAAFDRRAFQASRGLDETSRTRAIAAMRWGQRLLDTGRPRQAVGPLRSAVDARDVLDRRGGHGHRGGSDGDGARAAALLGEALVATGDSAGRQLVADALPTLTQALGDDDPAVERARAVLDMR